MLIVHNSITPDEITKILSPNYNDENFWSPLLGSPELVLHMTPASIERLFKMVVAAYKSDPLPGLIKEPLVILSKACRKLNPKDDILFEKFFRAITLGLQDNPRELLLKVLRNKVVNYSGASREIFISTLETLKNTRINNAKIISGKVPITL